MEKSKYNTREISFINTPAPRRPFDYAQDKSSARGSRASLGPTRVGAPWR